MGIIQTDFKGLVVFEPRVFNDKRGYFMETFNQNIWRECEFEYSWVQDNEAKSSYGVIRGLHFQSGKMAQAKLVRVITGRVLDVVVDIRKESSTYGRTYTIVLSGENKKQLLVPRGFAHGYAVLEDDTIFSYKCDNFYSKEDEGGINLADPSLEIDWLIPEDKRIISEKDIKQPLFKNIK
jgi:dTDP-4-dehydrorhamnose 3,5-epimerase